MLKSALKTMYCFFIYVSTWPLEGCRPANLELPGLPSSGGGIFILNEDREGWGILNQDFFLVGECLLWVESRRCEFLKMSRSSVIYQKNLPVNHLNSLLQFVHCRLNVFSILVAVSFHHCQGFMTRDPFHSRQVYSRLDQVSDRCMPQGVPDHLRRQLLFFKNSKHNNF